MTKTAFKISLSNSSQLGKKSDLRYDTWPRVMKSLWSSCQVLAAFCWVRTCWARTRWVRGRSIWSQLPRLQWRRTLCSEGGSGGGRRVSPLGIQMLSKPLHQQLFPRKWECAPTRAAVEQSSRHLREQGLWEKKGTSLDDLSIALPPLQGKNLNEHFCTIARDQSQPYLELATKLSQARLRPMPAEWSSRPGWTRYDPASGYPEEVGPPSDEALVLDVETCVAEGERPVLAVAASSECWYSWTSHRLASKEEDYYYRRLEGAMTLDDLIPLEPEPEGRREGEEEGGVEEWTRQRLVVGHHVSYDRARLKEQYFIKVGKQIGCSEL